MEEKIHELENSMQIKCFLKEQIAKMVNEDVLAIDENTHFMKFGISSIQTIMIINKIKKLLDLDLNPIAMFEHKNIAELAGYISECIETRQ